MSCELWGRDQQPASHHERAILFAASNQRSDWGARQRSSEILRTHIGLEACFCF
jgi:hypothetical protein